VIGSDLALSAVEVLIQSSASLYCWTSAQQLQLEQAVLTVARAEQIKQLNSQKMSIDDFRFAKN
jgi:hypothetical protein